MEKESGSAYLIRHNGNYVVWTPSEQELKNARKMRKSVGYSILQIAAYRVLYPIGAFNTNEVPEEPQPLRRVTGETEAYWLSIHIQEQSPKVFIS